jgi:hypothetical protein
MKMSFRINNFSKDLFLTAEIEYFGLSSKAFVTAHEHQLLYYFINT